MSEDTGDRRSDSMERALSGDEIATLLGGRVKIIRYRDLKKMRNLDDLLEPHGRVVILYESKDGYGHWTLVHRRGRNVVEMFDSYGLPIDDELDFLPESYRRKSDQLKAHLSQLLGHSPYRIEYNDHPLQSARPGVATCGRWCVLRALNANLGIDRFAKQVKQEAGGDSLDSLVCRLVNLS